MLEKGVRTQLTCIARRQTVRRVSKVRQEGRVKAAELAAAATAFSDGFQTQANRTSCARVTDRRRGRDLELLLRWPLRGFGRVVMGVIELTGALLAAARAAGMLQLVHRRRRSEDAESACRALQDSFECELGDAAGASALAERLRRQTRTPSKPFEFRTSDTVSVRRFKSCRRRFLGLLLHGRAITPDLGLTLSTR